MTETQGNGGAEGSMMTGSTTTADALTPLDSRTRSQSEILHGKDHRRFPFFGLRLRHRSANQPSDGGIAEEIAPQRHPVTLLDVVARSDDDTTTAPPPSISHPSNAQVAAILHLHHGQDDHSRPQSRHHHHHRHFHRVRRRAKTLIQAIYTDPHARMQFIRVLRYHVEHPVEQGWFFFPVSIFLGLFLRFVLQASQAHTSTCAIWYCCMIATLWLVQERLTVESFSFVDPLVIVQTDDVTKQNDPGYDLLQERESLSSSSSSSKNLLRKDIDSLHDFWSFAECIKAPRPQRVFTPLQEQSISLVSERFFTNEKKKLWKRSKHLCVNDNARWGAIRALDARQWRLEETYRLIDGALRWRQENNIDSVFDREIPQDLLHKMRVGLGDGFYGLDKYGNPVWYCPAGKVNLNAIRAQLPSIDLLVLLHLQMMEFNQRVWFRELSRKQQSSNEDPPYSIYQITIVLDLHHFGVNSVRGSAFWECLNSIGNIDRDYYYENVFRVYIINAPTFFKFFWRTLAPLFDPETRIKFQLLSDTKQLWDHIDPRVIPKEFGGKYSGAKPILYKAEEASVYAEQLDSFLEKWRRGGPGREDDPNGGMAAVAHHESLSSRPEDANVVETNQIHLHVHQA